MSCNMPQAAADNLDLEHKDRNFNEGGKLIRGRCNLGGPESSWAANLGIVLQGKHIQLYN